MRKDAQSRSAVWLALLLSAVAAQATGASSPSLWQQIQAEIGDAACDRPQQCRSIAAGAKACGGPEAYLAWSARGSDEARLMQLVQAHAQARRTENLKSGTPSDCRLVTDPGASCQAGRCVLLPPGSGAKTAD